MIFGYVTPYPVLPCSVPLGPRGACMHLQTATTATSATTAACRTYVRTPCSHIWYVRESVTERLIAAKRTLLTHSEKPCASQRAYPGCWPRALRCESTSHCLQVSQCVSVSSLFFLSFPAQRCSHKLKAVIVAYLFSSTTDTKGRPKAGVVKINSIGLYITSLYNRF